MKTFLRIAVAALMLAASLAATSLPSDSPVPPNRRGPIPVCDPWAGGC